MGESDFKIVDVNEANFDEFGAFCVKSKKNTQGFQDKAEWMKKRFKEGLRYKVLYVKERKGFASRGFIEYIPSEYAWRGISAEGYMIIHCIWVVGRNKGHGYGTRLLQECLDDAKAEGMNGVCVVTSERTWLPKKGLFVKNGFELADSMPPSFELYAKRFGDSAPYPKFNSMPESRLEKYAVGITVFKSSQCPYSNASVNHIAEAAKQANIQLRIEHIENCKEAQNSVHPYGTFCVLYDGKVVTYRPIGKKELLEYLSKA